MNLWLPYCQMKTAAEPLEVVSSEGAKLTLKDGRQLVDGIASWWTACHGYRHPHVVQAIEQQAQVLPHVMLGGIVHQPAIRLAERLATCLPGDGNKVFLSDSGSVAVEVAMKMALQYWANQSPTGKTARHKFVSFQNAYHGDTSGAMSLCDPVDSMHANFRGFLLEQFPQSIPDSDQAEGEFDKFIASQKHCLAAAIIEPLVQMAAGMRFHSPESLARIQRVCQRHDVLLIADEVATGFGRTGSMFAYQQAEIAPDILCVGKGLTGCSVGLAATIASAKIYAPFHSDRWEAALMHGPTYMGNPIACAAANASLDLFESQPRLEQVRSIQQKLKQSLLPLAEHDHVDQVQCVGAIGAVRMKTPIDFAAATKFFVNHGVWVRPIRDTVYLAPAFTISSDELSQLCNAVSAYVTEEANTSSPLDLRK